MSKWKITSQISFVFTAITCLIGLAFILVFRIAFSKMNLEQNQIQLRDYTAQLADNVRNNNGIPKSKYHGYIIQIDGQEDKKELNGIIDETARFKISTKVTEYVKSGRNKIDDKILINSQIIYFHAEKIETSTLENGLIITFTDNRYIIQNSSSISNVMIVTLILITILGNFIILIWSQTLAGRIKNLKSQVQQLSINEYSDHINIEGNDEITDLALSIEHMRQEISNNEQIKQEMLQNISHDFKTPIAVIRSYAEAIGDGITDTSETSVIIKQSELLNQKVMQLLELNKLEYLKEESEFVDVEVRSVINNIIDNQKYRTHLTFFTDLDDSKYFGIKENIHIAIGNIIDNSLRYAKKRIIITLKNKKLTIYNDGDPISEKFVKELFKPYEKGDKGNFGLGMSISQKTFNHFKLKMKVENINDGVMFTIEPI